MTPSQINDLTGPVVIFCIIATFAIMLFRIARHVHNRRKIPLLLIRDFLLYSALALFIAGSQYFRWTGHSLATEMWWVIATNALAVTALVAFLIIEAGIIGRDGSDDRWS